MLHDYIVRLIRTWVPALIAWLASKGIDLGVDLTAVVFALYYALVAFLEERVSPWFGWLLGVPKSRTK